MCLLKYAGLLKHFTQTAIEFFCQLKLFNEENILKVYKHFEVGFLSVGLPFFTTQKEKLEMPRKSDVLCNIF